MNHYSSGPLITSHNMPHLWFTVPQERIRVRYVDTKKGPGFPGWRPEADEADPSIYDDEPAEERWIFRIGPAKSLAFSEFIGETVKKTAAKYGIPPEILRKYLEK